MQSPALVCTRAAAAADRVRQVVACGLSLLLRGDDDKALQCLPAALPENGGGGCALARKLQSFV